MISSFISKYKLSHGFSEVAKKHYMPLCETIRLHQKEANKPYFVGINGSQGSGKSTLSAFIQTYLQQTYDLNIVVISLDDFYFSQTEREMIAKDVHPLFKTRGVPGTHNMAQAAQVLNALKNGQPTTIPRFNKAVDNPHPQSGWTKVSKPVDIIIFEGWCWGVKPQTQAQLVEPINQFESQEDSQAIWRQHVNLQLTLHYQPLYSLMNMWIMLKAPSFNDVFAWRLEQEQKLRQSLPDDQQSALMDSPKIKAFIQYYQRLTQQGLKTLPAYCDQVFELNSAREIIKVRTRREHAK